jgi:hypothetical protein
MGRVLTESPQQTASHARPGNDEPRLSQSFERERLSGERLSVLAYPLVAAAVIIAVALSLVGALILFWQRLLRRSNKRGVQGASPAVLNRRQPLNNLESQAD